MTGVLFQLLFQVYKIFLMIKGLIKGMKGGKKSLLMKICHMITSFLC
jgi:hypothetical protein